MYSLNDLRAWFMAARGDETDRYDINTPVTFTFASGHQLAADLTVGWFDGKAPRDHIGVELWITSDIPARTPNDAGLCLSFGEVYDTLDAVADVFGLDAGAAIWRKEVEAEQ